MSTIKTFTGNLFDVLHPDPELIDIRDVAHSLSLQCRGNGHVRTFFSVAQHCIICSREAAARGMGARIAMACLIHDASEAYMCDIPRPVKEFMPEYVSCEERLLEMIYKKYLGTPLSVDEKRAVKKIDDDMLYYDLKDLLMMEPETEPPVTVLKPSYEPAAFEASEKEYLEIFFDLKKNLE